MKPILQVGDPFLRKPTKEVPPNQINSPEIQAIIQEMIDIMRHAHGAGIAANQVGYPYRIFCVEVGNNPRYPYKPKLPLHVFINPQVKKIYEETFSSYEGCLSVPGVRGRVKRSLGVEVKGCDENGEAIIKTFVGVTGASIQHEYDHLEGKLFIDQVEDPTTFCSWDSFKQFHEESYAAEVKAIVAKYGS